MGVLQVVVHEATLANELHSRAVAHGHATPVIAGTFAKHSLAHYLLLTHFSTRYCNHHVPIQQHLPPFREDRNTSGINVVGFYCIKKHANAICGMQKRSAAVFVAVLLKIVLNNTHSYYVIVGIFAVIIYVRVHF